MDPSFYLRKLTIPEPLRKYSLPEHLQKLNDNIGLLKLKRRKKVRLLAFYIALINSKSTNCRIFQHSLLHKFLYTKITLRMRLCSVHTYFLYKVLVGNRKRITSNFNLTNASLTEMLKSIATFSQKLFN